MTALAGVIFTEAAAAVPFTDCPDCRDRFLAGASGSEEEKGVVAVSTVSLDALAVEVGRPRDDTCSDSDETREWGRLLLETEATALAGLVEVSSISIAVVLPVADAAELVKAEIFLGIMALELAGGLIAVESSSSSPSGLGSDAAVGRKT